MYRLHFDYFYSAIWIVNGFRPDVLDYYYLHFNYLCTCLTFDYIVRSYSREHFAAPTITSAKLCMRPVHFDLILPCYLRSGGKISVLLPTSSRRLFFLKRDMTELEVPFKKKNNSIAFGVNGLCCKAKLFAI